MAMNKIRFGVNKKLKVIGYISIISNLEQTSYGSKANNTTKISNAAPKKVQNKINAGNPSIVAQTTNKKASSANKKPEVYFRNKQITPHTTDILKEIGDAYQYLQKIIMEEFFALLMETALEEQRKQPDFDENKEASMRALLEQQKQGITDGINQKSAEEKAATVEKYKTSLNESVFLAAFVCFALLVRCLQDEDKKLAHQVQHLVKNYVHKLHRTSLDGIKHSVGFIYIAAMQQQQPNYNMTDKDNEVIQNLMTHTTMNLNAAISFFSEIRKILISHYGEDQKHIIDSLETNYCVIHNKKYSIIALVDEILDQLEKVKNQTNKEEQKVDPEILALLNLVDAYVLGYLNKDLNK